MDKVPIKHCTATNVIEKSIKVSECVLGVTLHENDCFRFDWQCFSGVLRAWTKMCYSYDKKKMFH